MPKGQDVNAIVRRVTQHRARERLIPLRRRQINVYPGLKGDYWVNRFEIKIKLRYAVTGNPFEMIDHVLDAVVEFDLIETRKRAMQVTELKSHIMKWAAYLERTLTKEMYDEFIQSLERPLEGNKDESVQA
ncbi:hypothetical protein LCGC14_0251840 [marine sediment metagenome]|uniref:Uncharacterized protein n=1 Tax=marine sediment metagenome TaxID=412755 RepID=A0A0F9UKZ7_9ZZZZ